MVDTRVEDEVAAATLTGAEILYCVQSGGPRNLTVDRIAAYAANPPTSDGRALGSVGLQWSDIFLASGAVLNFGGGAYTITQAGALLAFSGAVGIGGALTATTISASGVVTVGPGGVSATSAHLDLNSGNTGSPYISWQRNGTESFEAGIGVGNGSTSWQIYANATGIVLGITPTGVVSILTPIASTSTTTGALVVAGGIGLAGALNAGGNITINNGAGPSVFFQISGVTQSSIIDNSTSININSNAAQTAGMYILHGANAWSTISDARLPYKRAARDISDSLPSLDNFRLYENEVNGRLELFPKAQEVHAIFPHVVHMGDDDLDYVPAGLNDLRAWGMSYDRLGAIALAYARQHASRLDALEARLGAQLRKRKNVN